MYTKQSWTKGILVLSLVAVLSGYGLATERIDDQRTMSDQPSWEWGVARQDTLRSHPASNSEVGTNLHRASKLVGSPLGNSDGEKLGTIYDLVLTPGLDDVSYAVVSTGGFFGIGRQLHAIPWSAVETGIDGRIDAPINAREFKQDRGFTEWPLEGNPRWLSPAGERTERVTYGMMTAADRENIQNRRFSRIKGTIVKGPEDRSIGTIRDLVVATDTGSVAYTVVSFGGFLGLGQRYAAVPTTAVDFRPEQQIARVNVDRQALQAYAFAPNAFPNLSDPLYARQLNRAYGLEGSETVLGYVPPEPSTRGAMTIGPAMPYDAEAARTIQGVVTAVEKTARVGTGPEGLLLQVRSDAGDSYYVYAGPIDYVSKQDFFVVSGDRVHVTGAPARGGDRSLILAAQVAKDGQVLQLRNREGEPLWESSTPQRAEHHPEAGHHAPETND